MLEVNVGVRHDTVPSTLIFTLVNDVITEKSKCFMR